MNTKTKIEQLIVHEMPNTLLSHFKSGWFRFQWCGKIQNDEFKIWRNDLWSGFLYPIIKGKIIDNKVKLTYSLNPIGRILFFLWSVGLPILIISEPLRVLSNGKGTYILFIVVLIIPLCFYLFIRYVKRKSMKITVNAFKEHIKT